MASHVQHEGAPPAAALVVVAGTVVAPAFVVVAPAAVVAALVVVAPAAVVVAAKQTRNSKAAVSPISEPIREIELRTSAVGVSASATGIAEAVVVPGGITSPA